MLEKILKILDRPFFVTVIGGMSLAIAGYIYQTYQKQLEIELSNERSMQQQKMELLGDFADLSYARTQALLNRNTAIVLHAKYTAASNGKMLERLAQGIESNQKRIDDMKSISSVLYRIRPLLQDSVTLRAFNRYIAASDIFDAASDSLTMEYNNPNRSISVDRITVLSDATMQHLALLNQANDSLLNEISAELLSK